MNNRIFSVILDYCGGKQTDLLYEKLSEWNPNFLIHILDNASPHNKSKYITHQNTKNTGIGGGLKDCVSLAKQHKCRYVLIITNDIHFQNKLDITYFDELVKEYPDIVQAGVSLTKNSDKRYYPWMINKGKRENRLVHHSDILCCVMDIKFIEDYGGFPDSWSGWGFDWELGYQACLNDKKIVICDVFKIKHVNEKRENDQVIWNMKLSELQKVYNERYGSYKKITPFKIR